MTTLLLMIHLLLALALVGVVLIQRSEGGGLGIGGGSVKPRNANELMSLADVDGALVGGACLNPDDFWAIAQSCP